MPVAQRTHRAAGIHRLRMAANPGFTARTFIDKLIVNLISMTAFHHGQFRVHQRRSLGIDPPKGTVTVSDAVEQPSSPMAQFMNQGVPEPVCRVADFFRQLDLDATSCLGTPLFASKMAVACCGPHLVIPVDGHFFW